MVFPMIACSSGLQRSANGGKKIIASVVAVERKSGRVTAEDFVYPQRK
jgi:hypothetical protein